MILSKQETGNHYGALSSASIANAAAHKARAEMSNSYPLPEKPCPGANTPPGGRIFWQFFKKS